MATLTRDAQRIRIAVGQSGRMRRPLLKIPLDRIVGEPKTPGVVHPTILFVTLPFE
ncbi:MAG: hypothetical protein QNJ84_14355 [Alphaproteobacteria bacterium]|nr:hypothetical protein [Alphaproteobacteria bacterium]